MDLENVRTELKCSGMCLKCVKITLGCIWNRLGCISEGFRKIENFDQKSIRMALYQNFAAPGFAGGFARARAGISKCELGPRVFEDRERGVENGGGVLKFQRLIRPTRKIFFLPPRPVALGKY